MSQDDHGPRLFLLKRNLVAVEPVAFFAFFSGVLSATASSSISADKVCRIKLEIDDEICYNVQRLNHPHDEYSKEIYDYLLVNSVWENVVECCFPCVLLLFIGGWSDRTGHRKLTLLLPVIGRSLQIMNGFINAKLFNQIPLEYHMFFNAFFVSLFGGSSLMLFALFTYVSVTSSVKHRIYRLTSISVCATTGTMLGITFCRFILMIVDYYPILLLSLIMNAMTSLYIIYKVADPKRNAEELKYDDLAVSKHLKNFFDVVYIRETAEVISRKIPNNRDLYLCIEIISIALMSSVLAGEITVFHLIANNNYGWSQIRLQDYRMYRLTLSTIGSLISLGVITKWLNCHDSVIGIVSSINKIISTFVFCFVKKHIFYIGPIVGMLNGSSYLAMLSLISKLLDSKEVGKINALIFLLGNLVRLAYVPLYILIYGMTRHRLPGAAYLVEAGYTLPVLFVFIWLLINHRRESAP